MKNPFWHVSNEAFIPDAQTGVAFFFSILQKSYIYTIIVDLHKFKLFSYIHDNRKISMN